MNLNEPTIELKQGEYWRNLEAFEAPDCVHRGDRENPVVVPAGTVLLLQSIRDVDNEAHTIILRPHPSMIGMPIYIVKKTNEDGEACSWTYGELTEHRFLVADFLTRFVREENAQTIRALELDKAQDRVRQLQQNLIGGQNDPHVMGPVLALGIGEWEKTKGLDEEKAAYIATMPTSTALVPTLSGEHVEDLKLRVEREHTLATVRATWIKDRVEEIGEAVNALMPFMSEQAAAALSQTEDVIRKVGSIQKTIESLDLYIGKDVTVETLLTGDSAAMDVPLTIGQRKLFMNEEFSVWADVEESFDFHREEQFLTALKENESLRRQIFPSDRAIICMATRRTDKDYGDPWVNAAKNQVNKEVFLLVRDGGNLYRVYSPVESHLRALQLFPSRSEADAIFAGEDGNNINFMDTKYTDRLAKHELVALHYRRFLILLAGLDHRLELFGKFYEGAKNTSFVSLEFQKAHFRFVHDFDGEGMLGQTPRISLSEFLKENNKYLRSGSRVMCLWDTLANPKTAPGMTKEAENRNSGYYFTRHPVKSSEVCVVSQSQGDLVVQCATKSGGWRTSNVVQNSRVAISLFRENYYKQGFGYLVLDAIKADELEWYINDRESRRWHLNYIQLFKQTVAYLRKEEASEASIREELMQALTAGNIGNPEDRAEIVATAVRGWRAEHRGQELPTKWDKARPLEMKHSKGYADLLKTMYTIANAESLVLKAEDLLGRDRLLRLTVTGSNQLAAYVAPMAGEMDNRITPHVWVCKVVLEVKKTGLRELKSSWTVLPEAKASETTIREWAGAEQWTGLKAPFASLEEKKHAFEVIDERKVVTSPWLKETVTETEWRDLFEEWFAAYKHVNRRNAITGTESIRILFPIGLMVDTKSQKTQFLSVMNSFPHVRLWDLATTEEQKKELIEAFAAPRWKGYRGESDRRFKSDCQGDESRSLYIMKTDEKGFFPSDREFEFSPIPVLKPGTHQSSFQDVHFSLDWRLARGIDFINRYEAQYNVPHRFYHINEEIAALTLDRVFGHYTEELVTPAPPAPEEEDDDE